MTVNRGYIKVSTDLNGGANLYRVTVGTWMEHLEFSVTQLVQQKIWIISRPNKISDYSSVASRYWFFFTFVSCGSRSVAS